MTSDAQFRRAIFWLGKPVEFMKADWAMAYKHVSVSNQDHRFQLVEFGGRYFVDTALTFGALRTKKIINIEAKRLSGKLQHYSEMVSGKLNRCLIIHLGNPDGEDEEEIVIGK